jgi:MinD-like ATPase involved in chromosome partitioning or flagellar assembly
MVVDGAPWDTPLTRPMLVRLVADLREDHLFTLLDVGDDASDIGHGALARSDRLVVVTTNAADAVAATTRTFERLRGIDEASAAGAVVAVTGVRGRDRGTGDRRRAWPVARVVRVPWDPGFHGGGPIDAGRLRRTTRSALLELAAAVSVEHNS